jgi:carbon starvation protein
VTDPVSGTLLKAGWALWPIFGASNQMLAALTLMIVSIYFWKKNRTVLPLILPFIFLSVTTVVSLLTHAMSFMGNNRLLFVIVAILLMLTLWMLYEGWLVYHKGRSAK